MAPLAPLRVLRTASLAKRFTGGALFTSTLIAPEEFLMASQIETRTAGQAAVVLTGAALIGGTLTGFLGRSSQMRPVATGSMHMGSTMSARDASQGSDSGGGLNLGMSGNERDVLYDMGSAGNMMGNVTGFTPTLSSMGSAILDDPSSTSLPPLHRQ